MSKWLEQYNENYNGFSTQAKELERFMKSNYQGSNYIPWATMERLTYQQDPDADFKIISAPDAYTATGGIVHTQVVNIETKQVNEVKTVETLAQSIVHFVIVSLTFLGKYFEETYPIQDLKYGAPKVIDQNMVNKSLQRAKAKIAARATGLALKLYETGDLQFVEDAEVNPETVSTTPAAEPTVPKSTRKPREQKAQVVITDGALSDVVPQPKVTQVDSAPETIAKHNEVEEIVDAPAEPIKGSKELIDAVLEIRANASSFTTGFQKINSAVIKKYGFSLSAADNDLADKLGKIENIGVFMRTLRVQSGLKPEKETN